MPVLIRPAIPGGRLRDREQPTFHLDDLTVRPWQREDAAPVVEAYRDPQIQRWHLRSVTEAEVHDWLESWSRHWRAETGAGWAVVRGGTLVGRVGLRTIDLDDGSGELAYWTVPAARGHGVATRAVRAVSDWMFASVGLQRLELSHSTANPASCRVAAKAGFRYEGTRRGQGLHRDGRHDMHLHALLASDAASDPAADDAARAADTALDVRACRFADLDAATLYRLLRLRSDVFVVEQACVYPDLDGRDTEPGTEHLWIDDADGVAAYLRLLAEPDGGARIGRVCTRIGARGRGAAAKLVEHALRLRPGGPVVLDAQAHLIDLYARLGFSPDGPEFVEDGIPHVPMRLDRPVSR